MASSLLKVRFNIEQDGEIIFAQPTFVPTIELAAKTVRSVTQLEAGTAKTIWDPVNAPLGLPTDFGFLLLSADVLTHVEFTCEEGDADERLFVKTLFPNIPYMLGSSASFFDFTTDAFAGTAGNINRIRALAPDDDAVLTMIIGPPSE